MMDSRRRFLRRTGAVLGAAALTAGAGCARSDEEAPVDAAPTSDDASGNGSTPTSTSDPSDTPTRTRLATDVAPIDGTWEQYRADAANTGATDDAGPRENPDTVWRQRVATGEVAAGPVAVDGAFVSVMKSGTPMAFEAEDGSTRWHSSRTASTDVDPVASEATVVVADGDTVVGLAGSDRSERWTRSLDGSVVGLAAGSEQVVAATDTGLAAVDPDDGTGLWVASVDGTVATGPALDDGAAAVGLASGDVVAVDTESGDVRWRTPVADGFDYPPAACDGLVYVTAGSELVALDIVDGAEAWRVDGRFPVAAAPVATDDGVAVVTLEEDADVERTRTDDEDGMPTPHPTDTLWYRATLAVFAPDGGERWRSELTGTYSFTGSVPDPNVGTADGLVYASLSHTLAAFDAADGARSWSVSVDSGRPAVADGVASTGTVGVDVDDGTVLWEYDPRLAVNAPPAVVGNTLYVGSDDFHLTAVAANAGTVEWRTRMDGPIFAGPAVGDDRVYAGTVEGTLYAFDRSDGTERWTVDTGGTVRWSPALHDGSLYLGNFDNTVLAIDAAEGTERWRASYDDRFVTGRPAVGDDAVFAGANGILRAFETADGTERWERTFADDYLVQSSPAVGDGRVFVNAGESIYALDTADGAELWSKRTGGSNRLPAVRGETVYTSSDEQVNAFDVESGEQHWQTDVGRDPNIIVGDAAVFAVGYDTPITALDPDDGERLWRQRGVETSTAPALAGEYLFVGADEGWVYALGRTPE